MVLTIGIRDFNVKRVLIDPDSLTEVMYMNCFNKLGLKEVDLTPTTCPMIGFNGPGWLSGLLELFLYQIKWVRLPK